MALTDIVSGINGTTLLAIANVVFVIIAIFLFVRLRKIQKECLPEKTQQSEPAGVTNIKPAETHPESFEPPEKPMASAPDIGSEKTELRLEDELPEVMEMPVKKESIKKKAAKKLPGDVIEKAIIEGAGAPSEKIPIPEIEEVKPKKKEIKRRKPAKKEPEKVVEIKEETAAQSKKVSIPEKAELESEVLPEKEEKPEKKEGKKKRPAKKKIKKLAK